MHDIERVKHDPIGRRAFLARMSAAGLGAAAVTLLGDSIFSPATAQNPGTDEAPLGTMVFDPENFPGIPGRNINEVVLNFALTLEILEADLYRQALNKASGKPLTARLTRESDYRLAIAPGNLNPNAGRDPAADGYKFLRQFTFVEAAHRDFLRTAIRSMGGTPVAPFMNGYRFSGGDPGDDLRTILASILRLEETGVRAYLGAAPFLTDLRLIQVAGTIFSTEARHSAVISDAVGIEPGPRRQEGDQQVTPEQPSENTFEYLLPPSVVLQQARIYFVKRDVRPTPGPTPNPTPTPDGTGSTSPA